MKIFLIFSTFRPFRWTAELVIAAGDRITWTFNMLVNARAIAFDISKYLDMSGFGMLSFFTNAIHMEFLVRFLAFFQISQQNRKLRMILRGKCSQKCLINAWFFMVLFLLYLSNLPFDVICNIACVC